MNIQRVSQTLSAAALTVMLLGGCAASTSISGKVIQGPVGFVGIVDATDDRFKSDGVADAKVVVTKNPQEGGVRIGESASDAKGNFSVVVQDQSSLIRPAGVSASAPGFQPVSTVMNIPPASQRVLIILKSTGTTGTR